MRPIAPRVFIQHWRDGLDCPPAGFHSRFYYANEAGLTFADHVRKRSAPDEAGGGWVFYPSYVEDLKTGETWSDMDLRTITKSLAHRLPELSQYREYWRKQNKEARDKQVAEIGAVVSGGNVGT